MNYFMLITLDMPGLETLTSPLVVTVNSNATMQELYEHARAEVARKYPRFRDACVTYFGAWPNQLA
jgi:hypothetical protein